MSINIFSYNFPEPVGSIGIAEKEGAICRVLFDCPESFLHTIELSRIITEGSSGLSGPVEQLETDILNLAASRFSEYLRGERASFDLPLLYPGRCFTKKVYEELLKIPAGKTMSYRDVAIACGAPKAYRAVGMINKTNPIPFFIPCHRVVGSDGKLVGYAGGLPLKQYLLDLEKKYYT